MVFMSRDELKNNLSNEPKLNLEQIKDFWTKQAIQHGKSPSASWSDHNVIEMEIKEIGKYLRRGNKVLDIGCANGYSTIRLALNEYIDILGIDYIPEMVLSAKIRLRELKRLDSKVTVDSAVNFDIGNILDLVGLNDETYDKVITTRVLINLGDWENQLKALEECARVLKRGGLLLLSEATIQGWDQMNKFRFECGLSSIPIPPFNEYLDQDQVIKACQRLRLELWDLVNFSSTYYVGTRVLKHLVGNDNKFIANPDTEWNRWFSQLPSAGDYGVQKLFVFIKK